MAATKVGLQPKALLKLPKEMPSNIVSLVSNQRFSIYFIQEVIKHS